VWYPALAEFTFPTLFHPLTRPEGIAMMNFYQTTFLSRPRLTLEDIVLLDKLEKKIDGLLKETFGQSGAFLRLCGRSPKDGDCLDRKIIMRRFNSALESLYKQGMPATANTKLMAIAKVSTLHVSSGMDAMSLLLSSERVFTDLRDWTEFGEPEQIVLRAFEPEMTYDYEFRVFVSGNQVRAISQYDHYCVYPHLALQKSVIQASLLAFWQTMHAAVGEDNYICDLCYLPTSRRVRLIEISPFLPCTGPALFNWKKDITQLTQGAEVEFRLKTVETPGLDDLIETNWIDRWSTSAPPFWREYEKLLLANDNNSTDNTHTNNHNHYHSNPSVRASPPTTNHSSNPFTFRARVFASTALSSILSSQLGLPPAYALIFACILALLVYCALSVCSRSDPASRGGGPNAFRLSAEVASLPNSDAPGHADKPELKREVETPPREPLETFALFREARDCMEAKARALPPMYLFVYGTLKFQFQWNHKYLSRGVRLGAARTKRKFPLVVGACGVPYLLGDPDLQGQGHQIFGELYQVDPPLMEAMDEYEGISKGYYSRLPVEVDLLHGCKDGLPDKDPVFCYFLTQSGPDLRAGPFVDRYTMQMHRERYRAIRHIQIKQQKYMGVKLTNVST
jgi:gamma-glutamylcyclotransferase (GGCT)/AIG2-like uncharacterized protein YtfP